MKTKSQGANTRRDYANSSSVLTLNLLGREKRAERPREMIATTKESMGKEILLEIY
jgi:hypothetical protein